MALNLKHQTAEQFATRFWLKLQSAQTDNKTTFARMCYWLIEKINGGDITDTQARLSFNATFGRSLTNTQWTTLKNSRLIPARDRYLAMLNETSL